MADQDDTDRIAERLAELNLAAEFAAEGRSCVEAYESGQVIFHPADIAATGGAPDHRRIIKAVVALERRRCAQHGAPRDHRQAHRQVQLGRC